MKKADRQIVFDKFGGNCAYCGDPLKKGWHVDHLVPIRRNRFWERSHKVHVNTQSETIRAGRWVDKGCLNPEAECMDNYMPACASCNINKHSMSLEEFRNLISGFMKHLNERSTQYKFAKRYGLVKETVQPVIFYFETLIPCKTQ